MYFVTKEKETVENKPEYQFGVANGEKTICLFTSDEKEAERLVTLLNENGVEENHVLDIIEDMFYT